NEIYRAPLNQGSTNAGIGVFQSQFDLGAVWPLTQLSWNASTPANASVQVRSALSDMVFGDWTAATTSSPLPLTWTARYVEYRLEMTDPGAGNMEVSDVTL